MVNVKYLRKAEIFSIDLYFRYLIQYALLAPLAHLILATLPNYQEISHYCFYLYLNCTLMPFAIFEFNALLLSTLKISRVENFKKLTFMRHLVFVALYPIAPILFFIAAIKLSCDFKERYVGIHTNLWKYVHSKEHKTSEITMKPNTTVDFRVVKICKDKENYLRAI